MHKGATADQMERVRARRGPKSEPRDGRVLRQIRFAFWAWGAPLASRPSDPPQQGVTTRFLMGYAYPHVDATEFNAFTATTALLSIALASDSVTSCGLA